MESGSSARFADILEAIMGEVRALRSSTGVER